MPTALQSGDPVEFGQPYNFLELDREVYNLPLPQRDPETLSFCQQQCQLLIAKLSKKIPFIDEVRGLILERAGLST